MIREQFCSIENKYLNIFTEDIIDWSFQIRLELSHSVDYHRDIYPMNLIYYDNRTIYSMRKERLNFTDIVIVLNFQIRLELTHLVDYCRKLY